MPGRSLHADRPGQVELLVGSACSVVALLAAAALAGWGLDSHFLRAVLPGRVAMNPATAVSFLLAAASLWIVGLPERSPLVYRLGRALALIVALGGAFRFSRYFLGWGPAFDQWLFSSQLAETGAEFTNRMAPNTATCFALVGLATCLLPAGRRGDPRPSAVLGFFTLLLSSLALVGYAYDSRFLYGVPQYIPMAFNTALAFLALAIGTLASLQGFAPQLGGLLAPKGSTGVGRRLTAAVGIPLVLGWLVLRGERWGLYDAAFGVSLVVVATASLLAMFFWWDGRRLALARTERERADAQRHESEEKFRALAEFCRDAILTVDAEDRISYWNPAAERVFGYRADEMVGRHISELAPAERRAEAEETLQRVREGAAIENVETVRMRKDGARLDVSLTVSPIRDETGRVAAASIIARDITAAKHAREQIAALNVELRERLAELSRLNYELDAFSYSVSHDLRAPLRAIDGFAKILLEDHASELSDEARRLLNVVCSNAGRMGALIDDLLELSRLGRRELRRTEVDMEDLTREVVGELLRLENGRAIELVVGKLPAVLGDPDLLRQVLANLLGNAFKFTRGRDSPRVEIGARRRGDEILFQVKDNGAGFDMRYAGKLFQVFQRLHPATEFEGTGVGLALVQRIVDRHGGRVEAEGVPDEGATFSFTLPTQPIDPIDPAEGER